MELTQEQYDALPAGLKKFFTKAEGSDKYTGNVHSDTDLDKATSGLKSKNEELLGKLNTSKERIATLEADNHDLTVKANTGTGNAEALEKSYQKRIEKMTNDHNEVVKGLNAEIDGITSGSAASELAKRVFGDSSDIMMHHVKSRIRSEVGSDGKRSIRVLDKDGNASSLTMDDLEKEFRSEKSFAPVLAKQPSNTSAPPVSPVANKPGEQSKPMSIQDRAAQLINQSQ